MQDPVLEMGDRLFADHAEAAFAAHPVNAQSGACQWMADLWQQIEEMGLPFALLSEEAGGFGIAPVTALGLVRLAAFHAIPLPLGETMLANWLLAAAGLPLADGPASLAIGPEFAIGPELADGLLVGEAPRIAYGRHAKTVVIHAGDSLLRAPAGEVVQRSHNLAGEPRDTLIWNGQIESAPSPVDAGTFRLLAASLRVQGIAGALAHTLAMTVEYANTRQQFGRPIGRFQAIQQQLAVMAGQVAATRAAADMAAALLPDAVDKATSAAFCAAAMAAKIRAGEAAGIGAPIAHQVHAAIGFTQEYRLHLLTRRLWAWRDEWGREAEWAEALGGTIASLGPNGLWPFLTSMGAPVCMGDQA